MPETVRYTSKIRTRSPAMVVRYTPSRRYPTVPETYTARVTELTVKIGPWHGLIPEISQKKRRIPVRDKKGRNKDRIWVK